MAQQGPLDPRVRKARLGLPVPRGRQAPKDHQESLAQLVQTALLGLLALKVHLGLLEQQDRLALQALQVLME
jgi:hypothetical protein